MPSLSSLLARFKALGRRREIALILLLVGLAGGVWGFVTLASEVREGETATIDERLLLAFREPGDTHDPIGSRSVESAVRDVTALGSVTVLGLLTLCVGLYFFLDRRPRLGVFVLAAVASGGALTFALKFLFNRARPSILPADLLPVDPSFPSGHAALAAVVYLTLGLLLARTLPKRRLKVYVVALAAGLALAVGTSRIYLGMHWPSDVLAGWTLGGVWALVCWQAEGWLQRRGLVERSAFVRRPRSPANEATTDPPPSEPASKGAH